MEVSKKAIDVSQWYNKFFSALVDDPASKVQTNHTQMQSINISEVRLLLVLKCNDTATRKLQNAFTL